MSVMREIRNGTFDPEPHLYRNKDRRVVPSVTQILENVGFIDYERARQFAPDVLEYKRDLGQAGHYGCHIMARGATTGETLNWEKLAEEKSPLLPYLRAFDDFCDETDFQVAVIDGRPMTEVAGICNHMGMDFGYTFDLLGTFAFMEKRLAALIELKFTYAEEPSWKYQMAGYGVTPDLRAYEKEMGHVARVALQLKPDATFKCYPYDSPRHRDTFEWALSLTWAKINDGIPWRKEHGRNPDAANSGL